MFTHLRTKLTVLYAGLFAVGVTIIAGVVYTAIASNARRVVQDELRTGGKVYERVWALRSKQLYDSADLLSRDFGFRSAVASKDEATIGSALDNLKARVGVDQAFMVDVDGGVHGLNGAGVPGGSAGLWRALDAEDNASGVLMIGGRPYQTISAPIMSPTLSGWVVFAAKLDDRELSSLERLSPIPLDAAVVERGANGRWTAPGKRGVGLGTSDVAKFIDGALAKHKDAPGDLDVADSASIAVVKPLKTLGDGAPAVLLLRFSLAKAMAPYQPLLALIVILGFAGLGMFVVGSWALARNITKPISALDDATHKLERGEDVNLEVDSRDEIGRLAASFNTMAAEIRVREQKITHLAFHDAETGLPNRLSLERDLDGWAQLAGDKLFMVAAIGVDRFQYVRGAIGYSLANALIGEIGQRLAQLYPDCPRARLSTDVLGLAFEVSDLDAARRFASGLLESLEEPIRLNGDAVDISLTVGLAVHGVDDRAVHSLVERSSIALDQARAGKVKIATFDESAYGDPASNLSLTSEMAAAIARGDMMVYHQPKYNLRVGAVTAVEALVRWRHPTRGMVPPDLFIGMAEETGHIRALTEKVLEKAIADQARLAAEGHDLIVSVNVSGRLMTDHDFAEIAIEMIATAGANIVFEITETAVIDNPEIALGVIDRYAKAGIGISIDDYGAGLSSLTYLKQIPADELKIDKSFILTLCENQRDRLLVKSTIDLAHSLGLKVTAEGIETPATLAILTGMGCDFAQGYLISRPVPVEELSRFMNDVAGLAAVVNPAAAPQERRAADRRSA